MTAINIATIATRAGTQFRAKCEEGSKEYGRRETNIEDMMDLISRDVPFKTPIRIARCNDMLYLVDGFHRVAAYTRLEMMEIPADRYVIVDASSIEEVRALAAGANVQHGKGNTDADYHNIIKRMMDLGSTYMKNCFEPDIKKIAVAIGAAQPAVGRGYNDYTGTKEKPVPTLSSVCKEKRDAAILEQHKAGTKGRQIADLFGLKKDAVYDFIKTLSENPESGKSDKPAAPSVFPQANTQPRPDIRSDSSSLDPMIEHYATFDEEENEYIPFDIDEDEDDEPPFDVLAVTGYGEDLARHSKPAKKTKRQLLEERKATLLKELEEIEKELSELA